MGLSFGCFGRMSGSLVGIRSTLRLVASSISKVEARTRLPEGIQSQYVVAFVPSMRWRGVRC